VPDSLMLSGFALKPSGNRVQSLDRGSVGTDGDAANPRNSGGDADQLVPVGGLRPVLQYFARDERLNDNS